MENMFSTEKPLIWMFSGQGSQYYQMGADLYQHNEVFRHHMDALDKTAKELIGESIVNILYDAKHKKSDLFSRTLYTHPALFMVQYALAQSFLAKGLKPDALLGASLGEYVAAAVAEVQSAASFLTDIISQAKILEEHCIEGSMIAILAKPSLYEEQPVLFKNSEFVGANYKEHFVIAGSTQALTSIARFLIENAIPYQRLPVSIGFHSSLLSPVEPLYAEVFATRQYKKPKIPCLSTVTADWRQGFSSQDNWHIARQPILFQQLIESLKKLKPEACYLDLGPSATLAGFVKYNFSEYSKVKVYSAMSPFSSSTKKIDQVFTALKTFRHKKKEGEKNMKAYLFPGQGSQKKGMGKTLFDKFPQQVQQADEILGYSIRDLCLNNPKRQLNQTQFTQPALYFVSVLNYLKEINANGEPDFVAGHSLGEYVALFAAGIVDLETGLRLVQKRGELMSQASGGAMAAVLGLPEEQVVTVLQQKGLEDVNIANYNAPTQFILSGGKEAIIKANDAFKDFPDIRFMPLNVSAAFHSHYMNPTQQTFADFLDQISFSEIKIPIIANVTARPYQQDEIKKNLLEQISGSVKWTETIRYLWAQDNELAFKEVGPGTVLSKLVDRIKEESTPLSLPTVSEQAESEKQPLKAESTISLGTQEQAGESVTNQQEIPVEDGALTIESLGSDSFKKDYGIRYAYVSGAMYRGIASKEVVLRMSRAGLLGFLGTGGLPLQQIEEDIRFIQAELNQGQSYGMNMLHNLNEPETEDKIIDLYIRYGIRFVEASAYMQNLSSALVRYRLTGLKAGVDGKVICQHKIIAKVSRPEVAAAFLAPPPQRIIDKLLAENKVTAEQAEWAKSIPMSDDLCVEADSGGHTDRGVAYTLMPAMLALRDQMMDTYQYHSPIRVGAAGGIGTPEAAAAAFVLGADFILTGSINQCTVEAGTSDAAKNLLQQMNVQDTDYAPAGDMFELGAKVQVLKKGLFFPARGNRLYDLYQHYDSLDEIDAKSKKQLEEKYFKRSFDEIYQQTREFFLQRNPAEIEKAERNPKHKMALVFRWYFAHTTQLALTGSDEQKVDYQIHTGPALGAFNQWVKGTELEDWRNRHVDEIGLKLLQATASLLNQRFKTLYPN